MPRTSASHLPKMSIILCAEYPYCVYYPPVTDSASSWSSRDCWGTTAFVLSAPSVITYHCMAMPVIFSILLVSAGFTSPHISTRIQISMFKKENSEGGKLTVMYLLLQQMVMIIAVNLQLCLFYKLWQIYAHRVKTQYKQDLKLCMISGFH